MVTKNSGGKKRYSGGKIRYSGGKIVGKTIQGGTIGEKTVHGLGVKMSSYGVQDTPKL